MTAHTRLMVGYVRARTVPANPLLDQRLIGEQLERIAEFCERQGWVLDELFVDRGVGANEPVRPGLTGALEVLSRGQHTALVVTSLDRVTRSPADMDSLRTRAAGEGWHFVTIG